MWTRVKCELCSKPFQKKAAELKRTRKNFCSKSCSVCYSNSNRAIYLTDKICECGRAFRAKRAIRCIECRNFRRREKRKAKKLSHRLDRGPITCLMCSDPPQYALGKYCSEHLSFVLSEAGKKSVHQQSTVRRSKNEIAFANLCKTKFLVLENAPIFDGWDADVILPEHKLAILWNGNWHHKNISKKVSLSQIKNRDAIKHKIIVASGYDVYIVNDLGKFNQEFVYNQFNKLLTYLEERNHE